jgi:RNA polymerase sigma-70 factor (ECF subfamily)
MDSRLVPPGGHAESADLTSELLDRARAGDESALNLLFERHLPILRRWAHGRLPRWARDIADTTDLVQDTILQTLKQLDRFEYRGDGALQAYLRQAVMNRLRDQLRRHARSPVRITLEEAALDPHGSRIEQAVGVEVFAAYEQALARLRPEEREAIIGRIEMGYSYDELAIALEKPTADAARKAAQRALVRLAEVMHSTR